MQAWTTCALSGDQIETPVISKISGQIFEKKSIEKHIELYGTCPITGKPLSLPDLVEIKSASVQEQKSLTQITIPSLMQLMQNEWDSFVLEQFQLKNNIEKVRNELTHALYQHDAACRVIARVIKERDLARTDLAQLREKFNSVSHKNGDVATLPIEVIQDIQSLQSKMNNLRKLRRKQQDYLLKFPTQQILKNFSLKGDLGICEPTCLDVNYDNDSLVIVGGSDGTILLIDINSSKILYSFKHHSKRINSVSFIYTDNILRFMSCSSDGQAFCYRYSDGQVEVYYKYSEPKSDFVAFAIHPIRYLAVLASRNGTLTFHDLAKFKGVLINKNLTYTGKVEVSSLAIHPDGHFLTLGMVDGIIKIWGFLPQQELAQLEGQHVEIERKQYDLQERVVAISFSENGLNMASASPNEVNIWHLKTQDISKTFFRGENRKIGQSFIIYSKIGCLQFDESAQFLIVGEFQNVTVIETKKWEVFKRIDGHQSQITGIKFGINSRNIVTCSQDKTLHQYSE